MLAWLEFGVGHKYCTRVEQGRVFLVLLEIGQDGRFTLAKAIHMSPSRQSRHKDQMEVLIKKKDQMEAHLVFY